MCKLQRQDWRDTSWHPSPESTFLTSRSPPTITRMLRHLVNDHRTNKSIPVRAFRNYASRDGGPHPPSAIPADTRHWATVGSILDQRRRRWANIDPTVAQCFVLFGISTLMQPSCGGVNTVNKSLSDVNPLSVLCWACVADGRPLGQRLFFIEKAWLKQRN